MSENKIHFKLITHEKVVFEGDVDEIYAKGIDGEFGILVDHTPFMSALDIGVTKIVSDGKANYFAVMGGVMQIINNQAVLLTEDAENGKDINLAIAKSEKEKLEARVGSEEYQKDIQNSNKALAMALAKFKAAMQEK